MERLKNNISEIFKVGILLKGINGLTEIASGILIALIKPETFFWLIYFITQHEISEDPSDLVANYFLRITRDYSIDTRIFWVSYLFIHGFIKTFLIIALWKKKLWAYPTAMAVFFIFIIYQVYRLSYKPSIELIVISIFDAFIIILTYLEYKRLKKGKEAVAFYK